MSESPPSPPPQDTPPPPAPPIASISIAPSSTFAVTHVQEFAGQIADPLPPTPPASSTPPAQPPRPTATGRRYGFLCTYCSSRLEAVESMAGQGGTCPTCGNAIVIPILDSRGRLIDPLSGKVIKQDPHPVHAYAAAGHKAPVIITDPAGASFIKCPRCQKQNPLASNNCLGCGLPFTMEGTSGDAISGSNTWAVASLVLGIVGVAGGFCFVIPPLLAVIFAFLAMRNTNSATGQSSGQGLSIAGLILGMIGLVFSGLTYMKMFHF